MRKLYQIAKKKQKSLEDRGYMYHEKYEESIIEFQMLEKYTGEGFHSATLADMLWVQTQRVTDPLPDVDSIRRTPRMQCFRDWTQLNPTPHEESRKEGYL